jgi:hypothetical protein
MGPGRLWQGQGTEEDEEGKADAAGQRFKKASGRQC